MKHRTAPSALRLTPSRRAAQKADIRWRATVSCWNSVLQKRRTHQQIQAVCRAAIAAGGIVVAEDYGRTMRVLERRA